MNQKLVQSLVQIILALSDEEQEYLQSEIGKYSIKKQISELEDKLKIFESKYQMESEYFYQREFDGVDKAEKKAQNRFNTTTTELNI